jgi:hypothetical protein
VQLRWRARGWGLRERASEESCVSWRSIDRVRAGGREEGWEIKKSLLGAGLESSRLARSLASRPSLIWVAFAGATRGQLLAGSFHGGRKKIILVAS